jgi:hypothetical protein
MVHAAHRLPSKQNTVCLTRFQWFSLQAIALLLLCLLACVVPIAIRTDADTRQRRGSILCELPASTWTARCGPSSFTRVFSHSLEHAHWRCPDSLESSVWHSLSDGTNRSQLSAYRTASIVCLREPCPCHFCLIGDSVAQLCAGIGGPWLPGLGHGKRHPMLDFDRGFWSSMTGLDLVRNCSPDSVCQLLLHLISRCFIRLNSCPCFDRLMQSCSATRTGIHYRD